MRLTCLLIKTSGSQQHFPFIEKGHHETTAYDSRCNSWTNGKYYLTSNHFIRHACWLKYFTFKNQSMKVLQFKAVLFINIYLFYFAFKSSDFWSWCIILKYAKREGGKKRPGVGVSCNLNGSKRDQGWGVSCNLNKSFFKKIVIII